jgi:hypothetical protein
MAKKPNFDQERRERDRQKAAKKLEKAAAKAEKRDRAKIEGGAANELKR